MNSPIRPITDDACLKLTAYFDERQRSGDRFLSDAMLDLYERHRIATSIVLRGIGGFGSRHHLRSDRSLSLSEDPPVAVVAVDTRAAIEELVDPLRAIDKRALVTLERARLLADETGPVAEELHEATKLTIYLGRKERVGGVAAHVALCDLMRRRGLAGGSVFLGVDGTVRGHRERAHFFGGNPDVPMMMDEVGLVVHSGSGDGAVIYGGATEIAEYLSDAAVQLGSHTGAQMSPRVCAERMAEMVNVAADDVLARLRQAGIEVDPGMASLTDLLVNVVVNRVRSGQDQSVDDVIRTNWPDDDTARVLEWCAE